MTRYVAVIDIGKTNAKVALVDLGEMREIAMRTRPNSVLRDGPYPHFDVEALWDFVLGGLAGVRREHPVDAISVTTHGATAALLDAQGNLALPVLDYEHTGPDTLAAEYAAVRPSFEETGSPRLPAGLNVGAQIFWQAKTFPRAFAGVASIVMYAQYWSHRLSGVLANEVTSLGCHTDLWNPAACEYSSLVSGQGWRALMAPVRPARHRLGSVLPEIAKKTGLAPGTPVHCGIHDSNASLLPHLLSRAKPFAVVSTGTWVVSMAVGGRPVSLDPTRDTLINVNALGDPVPSARFMGGREFETLMNGRSTHWEEADLREVLSSGVMLLPAVQRGSGPFGTLKAHWAPSEPQADAKRAVAASFYLALMTATCLDLIGADGPTVVEGPFARNAAFVRMLAAATRRPAVADAAAATGTSVGAALLAAPEGFPVMPSHSASRLDPEDWSDYVERWRSAVGEMAHPQ
ncbi:Sugar (pentulose or hexulose) kinase [Mesorhizobium albiziae]|uniref:Sugar (Pentulose or hexulose) kinase n=1 Tax=Neomesorhizobium albiziae TaxID=335020 RepID=A0A1I3YUN0_9HYPH|nr:FGGY-family carbohydrate kinase [Mesorhizobium albiziae]GLS33297.1 carbohydrate kinase [Mesorhizobium albiziae]SFK34916.1 Sugar (pentulose or hexulose) kinase [Mesorhizobium albiziae]